jgi:hypothetical protein
MDQASGGANAQRWHAQRNRIDAAAAAQTHRLTTPRSSSRSPMRRPWAPCRTSRRGAR